MLFRRLICALAPLFAVVMPAMSQTSQTFTSFIQNSPPASVLMGGELVPVIQGGVTKHMSGTGFMATQSPFDVLIMGGSIDNVTLGPGVSVPSASGTQTQCLGLSAQNKLVTSPGACAGSGGSVTSVALSVPSGSLFSVTGSPVTAAGTLGLTTTGISGGIPYFSSSSQLSTSGALSANAIVLGGGAGVSPTTLAMAPNCIISTNGSAIPSCSNTVPSGVLPGNSVLAPHVPSTSALAAHNIADFPNGVIRDDAIGLNAGPLYFKGQTGLCAAQTPAQVNDGGSCINTTSGDNNSYRSAFNNNLTPMQFGAHGDSTGYGTGTDDATILASAFAAAVASGQTLHLGGHIYSFGTNLTMPDYLSIEGETGVQWNGQANCKVSGFAAANVGRTFSESGTAQHLHRACIQLGPSAASPSGTFAMTAGNGSSLDEVQIFFPSIGLDIDNFATFIRQVRITSPGTNGIRIGHATTAGNTGDIWIDSITVDCNASTPADAALRIENVGGLYVGASSDLVGLGCNYGTRIVVGANQQVTGLDLRGILGDTVAVSPMAVDLTDPTAFFQANAIINGWVSGNGNSGNNINLANSGCGQFTSLEFIGLRSLLAGGSGLQQNAPTACAHTNQATASGTTIRFSTAATGGNPAFPGTVAVGCVLKDATTSAAIADGNEITGVAASGGNTTVTVLNTVTGVLLADNIKFYCPGTVRLTGGMMASNGQLTPGIYQDVEVDANATIEINGMQTGNHLLGNIAPGQANAGFWFGGNNKISLIGGGCKDHTGGCINNPGVLGSVEKDVAGQDTSVLTLATASTLNIGAYSHITTTGTTTVNNIDPNGAIGGGVPVWNREIEITPQSTFTLASGGSGATGICTTTTATVGYRYDLTWMFPQNCWTVQQSSSVVGANPTATAGPTAVNGSSANFMRADAAPAIQKATNAQFGLAEGDASTVFAVGGVLSAGGLAKGGTNPVVLSLSGGTSTPQFYANQTASGTILQYLVQNLGTGAGTYGAIAAATGTANSIITMECQDALECDIVTGSANVNGLHVIIGAGGLFVTGVATTATPQGTYECINNSTHQHYESSVPCIGGMSLVSTQTFSGSVTNLAWTGLTGNEYQLRCYGIGSSSASDAMGIQFGEGGTPTWQASNYKWAVNGYTSGGANSQQGNASDSQMNVTVNFNTNRKGTLTVNLHGLAATTDHGMEGTSAGFNDSTTFAVGGVYTGNQTAVTAFRLIDQTGNPTSGTCSAYAIGS